MALAELKERHYPGYRDYNHPDHEVGHGHIVVSMEYFLNHRRTLNDPMSQAARQRGVSLPRNQELRGNTGTMGIRPTSGSW